MKPRPVALLGVPLDRHSSFAAGAALAPPVIRRALHVESSNLWSETGVDLGEPGRLIDTGDLAFRAGQDPLAAITAAVGGILAEDHLPLVLGGDHAISFPVLRAMAARHGPLDILQIDAHPDLYEDFEGDPHSHASPFARIMEHGLAARLVQVGIRGCTGHQREQMARYGVQTHFMKDIDAVPELAFERPVYVSVDLDGLDPAFAPGVAHHEAGGLSTRQVLNIVQRLRGRIVGADVVEMNPPRDVGGITAATAAAIVKELAGRMTAPTTR